MKTLLIALFFGTVSLTAQTNITIEPRWILTVIGTPGWKYTVQKDLKDEADTKIPLFTHTSNIPISIDWIDTNSGAGLSHYSTGIARLSGTNTLTQPCLIARQKPVISFDPETAKAYAIEWAPQAAGPYSLVAPYFSYTTNRATVVDDTTIDRLVFQRAYPTSIISNPIRFYRVREIPWQ